MIAVRVGCCWVEVWVNIRGHEKGRHDWRA